MAYSDTRALLDELMGKNRNELPSKSSWKGQHFSDPDVCKFYLCGFCPNELFTNTKSDLGTCTKIHDERLKQEYQTSKDRNTYSYEKDWINHLQRLVDDLDRRIRRGHDRLDHQDDKVPLAILSNETASRVEQITNQIQNLIKQIEEYGEEGRVDESQQLMRQVDQLKNEKEALLLSSEARVMVAAEKRMKVCEICGAFLVVGDTEKRTLSHMEGKQHQGFALIRKTLEDHKKSHRDEDLGKAPRPGRDRDFRERDRYHSNDRSRERSPRRDRDRERDHRRDSRDRDNYRRNDRRSSDRDREKRRERDPLDPSYVDDRNKRQR